jgi:hypothetical protein
MHSAYGPDSIYRPGPLCDPHTRASKLCTIGATTLIDYVIILALLLLLIVLSLPTMLQLTGFLSDAPMLASRTARPNLIQKP